VDGTSPLEFASLERIAVIRALPLADMLCTVPALRAIRAAAPEAHVTLIGLPWANDLLARYPDYIDEFVSLPGWPGIADVKDASCVTEFLSCLQSRALDLVLQLHGPDPAMNTLAGLLGATRVAGYYTPGEWCPDDDLYIPYPEDRAEIRRHLALVSRLGFAGQGEDLEFPVADGDYRQLARSLGMEPTRLGTYAVMHAGARMGRRWPIERFAQVGDAMARMGVTVVLAGQHEERHVNQSIAEAMKSPSLDLSGRTGFGALAALVNGAQCVLSNDTDVSHLADAVGTSSVVLFAESQVARWAPLNRCRHTVLYPMEDVSPQDAIQAVTQMLAPPMTWTAPISPPAIVTGDFE
jgi:ADP-heptose:LPS heptosyltransferase